MEGGWKAGLPYTKCGNGTLPKHSKNVYPALKSWIEKYGIKSVNDAGAGDKRLVPPVDEYRAFDLFPRLPHVREWDITAVAMPPCDLIVCRMVLNHVQERVEQTIPLLRQSGKYLAATQFDGDKLPQRSKQFKRLDLRKWLGEPLESVHDGHEPECRFALWSLC
jgi:hypothetical protein